VSTTFPDLATRDERAARWLARLGFGLLLSIASAVHAQSYRVDVRPDGQSVLSVEPGTVATVRFRVSNRGHDARFDERVDVPPNWRVVSGGSAFPLAEAETILRTVKIAIPDGARAGQYAIDYRVHDSQQPEMRNAAKASLQVLAPAAAKKGIAVAAETLLVETRINDQPLTGIIVAERLGDGRLVVPADAWVEARLRPAGEPVILPDGRRGYALESVSGLVYRLDRARLTLDITAPAAAFASTALTLDSRQASPPPTPPSGMYVNYDVFATRSQGNASGYGALVEGVVFTGRGSLVASAALRGDDRTRSVIRADTFWRRDWPDRMESLVIGDTIGSSGAWSRPVRFGGLRYARDFSLAPGYVTYPTPSIPGSAALPSTVDVLINNRRSATSNVQTGPFELANVPVVTGAGEMQLVVRDLLGRETVISQSYYAAPQLLAPGLSDFSFEAGALRENYGTRSNDYGPAFGAGTYRVGLTDTLTGEVRGEAQRNRGAAGASMATVVGQLGVVGLSASYAVSNGERGGHYIAGVQRVGPAGGASLAWSHFDRGYRQFGAVATETRPRDEFVAGGGLALGLGMTAGLNFTRQTTWTGDRFALVGANVGVPLPRNVYVAVYGSKQLEPNDAWSVALSVIVPFDELRTISASSTRDFDGHVVNTVQATQSLPAGPGWGGRVAASDSQVQRLQADVAFNGSYGQLTANANLGDGSNAVRVGANGSFGRLQGVSFASPRIDQGAFAMVRVGDLENVPVSLSNQLVAVTDRNGIALVTGLLPFQTNQLTINPDQLPFGVEIGGVREAVIPYARSGTFVDFRVRRSRDALVILQRPDGTFVPAGARVTVAPGDQQFVVAKRGEVYLMDLGDDNRIEVRWKDGGCALPLPLGPASASGEASRVGPLTCGGSK